MRGFWGWGRCDLGALCAVGDLLQAAESFVDGFGVWESVEQIGSQENDVRPLLHAGVVFAAHSLAEVKSRTRCEGIEFRGLLHIV